MPFSVHNNILTVRLKSVIIPMTEIRVIFTHGNHTGAFIKTIYIVSEPNIQIFLNKETNI